MTSFDPYSDRQSNDTIGVSSTQTVSEIFAKNRKNPKKSGFRIASNNKKPYLQLFFKFGSSTSICQANMWYKFLTVPSYRLGVIREKVRKIRKIPKIRWKSPDIRRTERS